MIVGDLVDQDVVDESAMVIQKSRVLRLSDAEFRRRETGKGPRRCLSRDRNHFGFRLPGGVQHHDVGRAGSRQGTHPAPHELWRVVARVDARRFRTHPQREDAAVYELGNGAGRNFFGKLRPARI